MSLFKITFSVITLFLALVPLSLPSQAGFVSCGVTVALAADKVTEKGASSGFDLSRIIKIFKDYIGEIAKWITGASSSSNQGSSSSSSGANSPFPFNFSSPGGDRAAGLTTSIIGALNMFADKMKNPSPQNTANQDSSSPIKQQGEGGDRSQQSGEEENGSEEKPYKLEPNQFKKVCGKNEYVLWWSKRGSDGKDLKEVKDKMQNSWLTVPKCEEMAKCHCCCNTCTLYLGPFEPCTPDHCFSNTTVCEDKKECSNKCVCQMCKNNCKDYKKPTHQKAFDSDCDCKDGPQVGCPEEKSKNCKIVLFKSQSGWEGGKYRPQPPENLKKQDPIVLSNQTKKVDNTVDDSPDGKGQKITLAFFSRGADAKKGGNGWIDKLEKEKGQCCKCIEEKDALEGPKGTGK